MTLELFNSPITFAKGKIITLSCNFLLAGCDRRTVPLSLFPLCFRKRPIILYLKVMQFFSKVQ